MLASDWSQLGGCWPLIGQCVVLLLGTLASSDQSPPGPHSRDTDPWLAPGGPGVVTRFISFEEPFALIYAYVSFVSFLLTSPSPSHKSLVQNQPQESNPKWGRFFSGFRALTKIFLRVRVQGLACPYRLQVYVAFTNIRYCISLPAL